MCPSTASRWANSAIRRRASSTSLRRIGPKWSRRSRRRIAFDSGELRQDSLRELRRRVGQGQNYQLLLGRLENGGQGGVVEPRQVAEIGPARG